MIGKANALVELWVYPAWRTKSGTWSKKDSPARQTRDTCVSAIFWPCLTLLDTHLRLRLRPAPAGSGTGPAGWRRGACAARPQPPASAIAALSPAGEWLHGPMRLAVPASLSRHPRLADGVDLSTRPRVGRSEIRAFAKDLGPANGHIGPKCHGGHGHMGNALGDPSRKRRQGLRAEKRRGQGADGRLDAEAGRCR